MSGQNLNNDDGGWQQDGRPASGGWQGTGPESGTWQQAGGPAAGGTGQGERPAAADAGQPTTEIPRPTVAPAPAAPYGEPYARVPYGADPQDGVPRYGSVPPSAVPVGSTPQGKKKWWTFPRLLVAAGIAVILAGGGGGAIGYAVGNAAPHHQLGQRARLGTGGYGRHVPGSGLGGEQGGTQPTQGATNP